MWDNVEWHELDISIKIYLYYSWSSKYNRNLIHYNLIQDGIKYNSRRG